MEEIVFETRIFFRQNELGEKVKVTQKIKKTRKLKATISERRRIPRFGDALTQIISPMVEEEQRFVLSSKKIEEKKDKQVILPVAITCRICKGLHFTSKCNNRDLYSPTPSTPETSGKYIPPNRREGAVMPKRENQSLRIDNISADTREQDIRDLFGRFGSLSHVFFPLSESSGDSRGFAFVSFYDKINAEKCIKALDGFRFDSLVLCVEWSKQKESKRLN